jgi:hypothetical protein
MDSHIKAHRFFVGETGIISPSVEVSAVMELEQLELF